jgi:quercetin dioxygenase-like cupin family protein
MTLDQLAEAADVSRRMLVNVEQGAVNPSVGTLLKLSDALGIGLPSLVEMPTRSRVTVVRDGDGAALWSSPAGGRGVLLVGSGAPDVAELWEWTLMPGDRPESDAHSVGTEELIQVREGVLRMTIGDDAHDLAAGDAILFAGDVAHSYGNPGEQPTRFTMAVFEPGVGVAHGSRSNA